MFQRRTLGGAIVLTFKVLASIVGMFLMSVFIAGRFPSVLLVRMFVLNGLIGTNMRLATMTIFGGMVVRNVVLGLLFVSRVMVLLMNVCRLLKDGAPRPIGLVRLVDGSFGYRRFLFSFLVRRLLPCDILLLFPGPGI